MPQNVEARPLDAAPTGRLCTYCCTTRSTSSGILKQPPKVQLCGVEREKGRFGMDTQQQEPTQQRQQLACLHLPIAQASGGEQPDVWLCLKGVPCPTNDFGVTCLSKPTSTSVSVTSELDRLGAFPVLQAASLRAGASGCEVYAEPGSAQQVYDVIR